MARQERAVDPGAGPLQAFAHELRKIRMEAGNPTYRALAKLAGYSATTLSEAASGVRRPSLEVVLAYVGACRGDVDLWRQRWHALDVPGPGAGRDADGSDAPAAGADAGAAAEARLVAAAATGVASGPAPRRRHSVGAAVAVVACGTLIALATGAFALYRTGDPKPAASSGCPRLPSTSAFTAITYGVGATAQTRPERDAPVARTIPSGCVVGFTGFCLGEKLRDRTAGTPDIRWFILPDGTVISSTMAHGNPPPTLPPEHCPHDRPAPSTITVAVDADRAQPAELRVHASGGNLTIVGFAVSSAAGSGQSPALSSAQPRKWRQLALAEESSDSPGFHVTWRWDGQSGDAGRGPAIAAVACLGGNGPTGVVAAVSVPADNPAEAAQPLSLTRQDKDAAARAACAYPA